MADATDAGMVPCEKPTVPLRRDGFAVAVDAWTVEFLRDEAGTLYERHRRKGESDRWFVDARKRGP